MKNLKQYNVKEISTKESYELFGGGKTPWGLILYIIDEIYDGLKRECPPC